MRACVDPRGVINIVPAGAPLILPLGLLEGVIVVAPGAPAPFRGARPQLLEVLTTN